jgi:TonB family protein
MSASLVWNNIIAYSLQIGLLVGLAAFVPTLLRLRMPTAKLAYWQILLATCLLLPAIRPWRQQVVAATVEVTSTVIAVDPAAPAPARHYSLPQIALAMLIAGAAIRLIWLAVGLWRLRIYRRRSQPWAHMCLISEDVSSPVTFGWRNPVVLLPAQFPSFDHKMQDAILCHEMLHIERRDWLFTLFEELTRSVFWFHPAIWWLLGEIQLAREQAVDRKVVDRTQARDTYVDTLLAIAGAGGQLDLAPAPLFLRKRHLKHRVVSILKEARMSKMKWISGLAASLGILVAACWFVTSTFPLAAAPQVVNDAPGVAVDLGGAALIHRSPVAYGNKRIQGIVAVEARTDASGNVVDARVLSGPDELRKDVIESVLQWHFAAAAAGTTHVVSIRFQPPAETQAPVQGPSTVATVGGGVIGGVISSRIAKPLAGTPAPPDTRAPRTIKSIGFTGVSDQAEADLRSRLPIHVGDTLTQDLLHQAARTIAEYDEHLALAMADMDNNEVAIAIRPPGAPLPSEMKGVTRLSGLKAGPRNGTPEPTGPINIGGNVQQAKLVRQPKPAYPPDAKQQRIQGVVKLQALIGVDGQVKDLAVIEGEPILAQAAMDAVWQWVYQPTLLNGNPVEVKTQIDVNFTLSQ